MSKEKRRGVHGTSSAKGKVSISAQRKEVENV